MKKWWQDRGRDRVVIVADGDGYRFQIQSRWRGLWYRVAVNSVVFASLQDSLMGLATAYLEGTKANSGLHIGRKQRKRIAAKIAMKLVAR